MGRVINSERLGEDKIKLKILMDVNELASLQGNYKNVHLFSATNFTTKAEVMESAINKVTKYFKIPQKLMVDALRKKGRGKLNEGYPISCLKLETTDQFFFIYIVNKSIS